MPGLATGAEQTGVAGVKNDFAERKVFKRDNSNTHFLRNEVVDAVANLWRQSKKRRFDGVNVGTGQMSARCSLLACCGAYIHFSHSRSSTDSSEGPKQSWAIDC